MKNSSGQASIEMVLMVATVVFVVVTASQLIKQNEIFAQLVSGPWKSFAGLIQNGVLGSPEKTMDMHPNQFSRLASIKGQEVRQ